MEIFVMVCVVALAAVSFGQVIAEVKFDGFKPPPTLRLYTREGREFFADSLRSDSARILSAFQQQGRLDCQLAVRTVKTSKGLSVFFAIDTGQVYRLFPYVAVAAETVGLDVDLSPVFGNYTNKPATQTVMEELANDLVEACQTDGYPYVEIKLLDLRKVEPETLYLGVGIQTGPQVDIVEIDFPGRRNLHQNFLRQYTGMVLPARYSTSKVALVRRRFLGASFLREVGELGLAFRQRPEQATLIVPIKEKSPLILNGAFALSSSGLGGYGQITAELMNLLGRGRQARVEWRRKDRFSSLLKLDYQEPMIVGSPIDLIVSAFQEDRDTLLAEIGGGVGIFYHFFNLGSLQLSLGGSEVRPESLTRHLVAQKEKYWLALGASIDTRDDPRNPRHGEHARFEVKLVKENIAGDSLVPIATMDYRMGAAVIEKYLGIGKRSVLAAILSAQGDFSGQFQVDRQFAFGGAGSLRGYDQGRFYVLKAALFSLELRLLTPPASRAYFFADVAVMQSGSAGVSGRLRTLRKAAVGVGVMTQVRPGTATIELAVPSDEGIKASRLHLALGVEL